MALTVPAVVSKAAQEARNILGAVPGLAAEGAAQYVKQGTPSGVIPNVGVALARQACRRWAQQPGLVPDAVDAGFERVCRPYLDDIGYGTGPELEVPFRGGQCAGALYRVTYSWDTVLTSGEVVDQGLSEQTPAIPGPISGFSFQNQPGNSFIAITFGAPPVTENFRFSPAPQGAFANATLDSIVRVDGGADDCGNPPVVIRPPTAPPGPVIDIDPIVIVPIVNIDAGLVINVDGSIDIEIDGIEVTIDPFGEGEDGGGGGTPPGGPGTPGTPEDTGEGGDSEGEAPEGQVLTGLRINFLEPPIGGKEYVQGVYRGVCYIYMGTEDGLDHDPAGAMLRDGQFVYAEKDYLTRWTVTANRGYNLRVTPYYRAAEAEE